MILNIACIATTKHYEHLLLYEQAMRIPMYFTGNIFVLLIFKNYQDVWYLKRVTYHRLQYVTLLNIIFKTYMNMYKLCYIIAKCRMMLLQMNAYGSKISNLSGSVT